LTRSRRALKRIEEQEIGNFLKIPDSLAWHVGRRGRCGSEESPESPDPVPVGAGRRRREDVTPPDAAVAEVRRERCRRA
jgi:hypothetical protein